MVRKSTNDVHSSLSVCLAPGQDRDRSGFRATCGGPGKRPGYPPGTGASANAIATYYGGYRSCFCTLLAEAYGNSIGLSCVPSQEIVRTNAEHP